MKKTHWLIKDIDNYHNADEIKPQEISEKKQYLKFWLGWLFDGLRFIF